MGVKTSTVTSTLTRAANKTRCQDCLERNVESTYRLRTKLAAQGSKCGSQFGKNCGDSTAVTTIEAGSMSMRNMDGGNVDHGCGGSRSEGREGKGGNEGEGAEGEHFKRIVGVV